MISKMTAKKKVSLFSLFLIPTVYLHRFPIDIHSIDVTCIVRSQTIKHDTNSTVFSSKEIKVSIGFDSRRTKKIIH